MKQIIRLNELAVLLYRILLVYVFYQIARGLFWRYNRELLDVADFSEYLHLAYRGFAFDTTAILYVNGLFILLSLLPLVVNTRLFFQKILFWIYFIFNGIAFSLNFGDFIYFPFSQSRLTTAAWAVAGNENNLGKVAFVSLKEHPMVLISFVLLMSLWVFLYKKVKVEQQIPKVNFVYFLSSILLLGMVATLAVGGIRGDFKHSTRPINIVDANKHVRLPIQGNLVLNSPFSLIRTFGKNHFKEVHFVDEDFIAQQLQPIKQYQKTSEHQPNIVILIVESFGREYSGAFNQYTNIPQYESFTPFIDSLATQSLIFPNSFANGRQSIHAMSSILAGIPSLKAAFTSSPYANQNIQSLVSIANELGYDTSFYHGAPNGSMGFQGFGNILGFQHYFGKDEYNNDADFDGMWAIWDEPFLQYFAKNIGQQQPFFTTMFTASSHHPYVIPNEYEGKFKKGYNDMHEPIQYTDLALKKFFETAKKQSWYKNTIFVITGDHTNKSHFDYYNQTVNHFAVPILFYSPNPDYQLQGIDERWAQQMDIYPTVASLMNYEKPIRSWGVNLLSQESNAPHYIVNSDGITIRFAYKNYIYTFDGNEIIGWYEKTDYAMEHNLISKEKTAEIIEGEKLCKAWYQDFMDRIINKKL
ncbi:LTA synthase family protein [Capnocytophaga sp. ARDL2]|uniref:LTA synthase family protein n=1 Tax=Capnocytophaga sp. ARDL2 TaxID=3238809 RepID=UPI0035566B90